jgi:hypothetical protein
MGLAQVADRPSNGAQPLLAVAVAAVLVVEGKEWRLG